MKANRKFVTEEEAVSPVIAVILMVAITVVLAATVFVLVSDIGGQTGSAAPSISFSADEGQDRLSVNQAGQNADWNRLTVSAVSCSGADDGTTASAISLGSAAADSSHHSKPALAPGDDVGTVGASSCTGTAVQVSDAADRIEAGDFLEFCVDDALAGPVDNVEIQIRDTTANAIVHTYTFTDVADCS